MSTNPEPGREAAFFTTIRSWGITRSDDRLFGGVATGVGERIGLARVPARILTVVAAFVLGGLVTVAYAAAWALLPDRQGRIIIQDFGRGVPNVGALIVIAIFALVGFGSIGDSGIGNGAQFWHWGSDTGVFGWSSGWGVAASIAGAIVFLAVVGGIVAVIVWAVREGRKSPPSQPPVWAAPRTPSNEGGDSAFAAVPPMAPTGAVSDDDKAAGADDAGAAGMASEGGDAITTDGVPGADDASTPDARPASAYGAAASAYGAPGPSYAAAAPVRTYAAPAPRAPRVPGPGPVGYLAALAWLPLSFAIAYGLEYQGRLSVYPWVAAGATFAAGLGIMVAIVALTGRRLGFLGFVATLTLIPVSFGILQADQIRSTYEHGISWSWGHPTSDPVPSMAGEPVPTFIADAVDPSDAFAADYAFIQLGASCFQQDTQVDPSAAVIRLSSVTADASIDITAPNTRVVIPNGTSLAIVRGDSGGEGTFSLQWIARDIACEVLPTTNTYVTLTNPDTPKVTLRMTNDGSFGTIQIEEQ